MTPQVTLSQAPYPYTYLRLLVSGKMLHVQGVESRQTGVSLIKGHGPLRRSDLR